MQRRGPKRIQPQDLEGVVSAVQRHIQLEHGTERADRGIAGKIHEQLFRKAFARPADDDVRFAHQPLFFGLLASASAVLTMVGAGCGGAGIGVTIGALPLNTGAGSRTVERRRGGSAGVGCGGADAATATGSGRGAGSIRGA